MRPTTCLTTIALLGLGLLGVAPIGAASGAAAGQTCRGEAATIVGSGRLISGTEGRDVVVTNGASTVKTLGGNDLVCVTGRLKDKYEAVYITAGAGDDVVDGSTSPRQMVDADLGTGVDRFIGGNGDDYVDAVPPGPDPAMEPDTFSGGGGDDVVGLYVGTAASVIDNSRGQFSQGQRVLSTWSGMEEFSIFTSEGENRGDVDFIGTAADESINDFSTAAGVSRFDLGGGNDSYYGGAAPKPGSTVTGGKGRDLFYLTSESGLLDLDLASGLLQIGDTAPYSLNADSFENASLFATRVVLAGDNGANKLALRACDGTVQGRKGSDKISRKYDMVFESSLDCTETLNANGGPGRDKISGTRGDDVLSGGSGNDRIRGGFGNDLLLGGGGNDKLKGDNDNDVLKGGRGFDRADGGPGKDKCQAERKRRC